MCKACDEAWTAFEAWLTSQPDEVQDLTLLEQIDVYAAQSAETEQADGH